MITKKRGIYVLLALVIIFISGCKSQDTDTISGSFVGGDNGLELSFINDEPPTRVLDNNAEQFFVTISMKNKGEFTIEPGKAIVTLSGISKDQFQLDSLSKKNENQLPGVVKERTSSLEGGQDEVSFNAKFKQDLNQDFMPTITANICYAYGSRALSNVCLRRDVVRREQEGECVVDEDKKAENSGSPIHVVSFKERKAGPNEIKIIFDLQNVGSGKPFSRTAFSSGICGEDPTKEDFVNVEVRPISNVNVRCDKFAGTGSGVVRLNSEGKATVSCDVSTSALQDTAFEEPLNINLDYIYKERISKQVTVENSF